MRKILPVLIGLLFSTNVFAGWDFLTSSDDSSTYVNLESIRKTGSLVKMWGLTDYKNSQQSSGASYNSALDFTEYDCKNERLRSLAWYTRSGNMGDGKIVDSIDSVSGWRVIIPGSIGSASWAVACGKRKILAERKIKKDDWILAGNNETSSVYGARSTIRKSGGYLQMWVLYDFKEPSELDNGYYRSTVSDFELDCQNRRSRSLISFAHFGGMGEGQVIYIGNRNEKWDVLIPDSFGESVWKFACEK